MSKRSRRVMGYAGAAAFGASVGWIAAKITGMSTRVTMPLCAAAGCYAFGLLDGAR